MVRAVSTCLEDSNIWRVSGSHSVRPKARRSFNGIYKKAITTAAHVFSTRLIPSCIHLSPTAIKSSFHPHSSRFRHIPDLTAPILPNHHLHHKSQMAFSSFNGADPDTKPFSIAIVGGGLGGLALAIGL